MRRRSVERRKAEPTIALINVVFLLLVFFLIAGQLSPPMDQDIKLASVKDLTSTQAPDALVIDQDGALSYQGVPITPEAYWDEHPQSKLADDEEVPQSKRLRLVPDRRVPAVTLLGVANELRKLGARDIWIVTQRGLDDEG
ncbi:biopolymer transport protein ExbD [Aliiroseovarius halocynthiae]|uniref:Biopolymer transporter ExbD n=1 Tax=Aliiroseovarius halocynthiae TaxID=985055 RepID=A0A545SNZ7_9RHOB|nr:biopolymer transporter ExbD [Aliiroseovarius halocynthiae]TQV66681.1 biopolymer transporter ExbD [Aliiroseovarius halocynthiae]SMR82440.1 biopolymer transport protein ExbD [Aliiroseovarius halocynthiae]